MSVYLISDTHFGHKNIIKYCNRPFETIQEMDEEIIKRWNLVVTSAEDIVYHLGDFGWGNKEEITRLRSRLNGRIYLVKGNHDYHGVHWYYDCGFERVYDCPIVVQDFYILTHAPIEPIDMTSRYANIHGHVHEDPRFSKPTARSFNVSCENINYTPIDINLIIEKMKKVEKENQV